MPNFLTGLCIYMKSGKKIKVFDVSKKTIDIAKENNYSFIISHRSGETEDSIIADIADVKRDATIRCKYSIKIFSNFNIHIYFRIKISSKRIFEGLRILPCSTRIGG